MYPRLLLRFIQYFSFLQQYLIILSVSIVFLILFHYWWCILLLPLSTIGAYFAVQRLSRSQQSPIAFTGHLYDFFIRKRTAKEINEVIQIENCFQFLLICFHDLVERCISIVLSNRHSKGMRYVYSNDHRSLRCCLVLSIDIHRSRVPRRFDNHLQYGSQSIQRSTEIIEDLRSVSTGYRFTAESCRTVLANAGLLSKATETESNQ